MTEQTNSYKLTCLISPILEQKEIEEISQKIKKWIIEKNGSFSKKENPLTVLKKGLSYPVKKYREAFYLNYDFNLARHAIKELSQKLNLEKKILRHLITTCSKNKDKTALIPEIKQPMPGQKQASGPLDYGIIDKIEPLIDKEIPLSEKTEPSKPAPIKKEKVKIEEIDKKLEEILNQ